MFLDGLNRNFAESQAFNKSLAQERTNFYENEQLRLEERAKIAMKNFGEQENSKLLKELLTRLYTLNPEEGNYLMGLGFLSMNTGEIESGFNYYLQAYKQMKKEEALIHIGLYAKALNQQELYVKAKKELAIPAFKKAERHFHWLEQKMDTAKDIPLTIDMPATLPEKNHLFVLLGYELRDDGTMQEPLMERLKIAKEALVQFSSSKIIVSGGIEKNGFTEARQMSSWLIRNGIDPQRILQENQAVDSMENSIYSLKLIEEEKDIHFVTLLSSASHIRRATALFELVDEQMAQRQAREKKVFTNISYQDFSEDNRGVIDFFGIARDSLRITGLWGFPGFSHSVKNLV